MKSGCLSIGLMVLLGLTAPLAGQDADLAERLYRSGERAYAAQSFGEAMETWAQLVQQDPRTPQAAWALLRMARHRAEVEHKPEAALTLLDRVRTDHLTSPAAPEALLLRGQLLARRARRPQELQEAMAEFNRVFDLFPQSPEALESRIALAQTFLDQGQPLRALPLFLEPVQADPEAPVAARGLFGAAKALDQLGDLHGSLTLLQRIQDLHPDSPEASEARWHLGVLVRHRFQKPALKSLGPWPQGRSRWLKTPTLLATGPQGELFVFQDDLSQIWCLHNNRFEAAGPAGKGAKALASGTTGLPWLLIPKVGAIREDGTTLAIPGLAQPSGGFVDRWGTLWVGDAKAANLTLVGPDGSVRSLPSPTVSALAPLPTGGAVIASDASRSLQFVDAQGQVRVTVPYGKDLPAGFKTVLALTSDPLGHVAALVEGGDFEGLVIWGPDGTLLRQASFKALGISGRFRALVLDRQGGVILADRTHDLLLRIE